VRKKPQALGAFASSIFLTFFCLFLCSCTSFRGLPGHGGGKRFDEEQRMLSSSIKATVDEMDLSVLVGKKVRLFMEAVETSGSGRHVWAGFRSLNPNMQVRESGAGTEFTTTTYPLGYGIDANYWNNNNITSKDIKYFEFMLKMRCRLEGIRLVNSGQDIDLLVGVDVLGTNRSRDDHLIVVRDHLGASTEVTYCCIDVKTGKVLLGRSSTGSKASYSENWMRLTNIKIESRKMRRGLEARYGEGVVPVKKATVQTQGSEGSRIRVRGDLTEKLPLDVEVIESEAEERVGEDELYQLGLDAVSRQDRRELRGILDRLGKKFSSSSYIEILESQLNNL